MNDIVRNEKGGVFIDCPPSEFGSFLQGLLKSPRTTANQMELVFNLSKQNIDDIIYLIDQRIKEQHDFSLIEFQARVRFLDGRETRIGTFDEFMNYGDIGNQLAKFFSAKLVFLIKAPQDARPHRQSIYLNFHLYGRNQEKIRFSKEPSRDYLALYDGPAHVHYEIEHTLVSFGEDLASLIERKVKSFSLVDLDKRFWKQWYAILLFIFSIFMLNLGAGIALANTLGNYLFPSDLDSLEDIKAALRGFGIYNTAIIFMFFVSLFFGPVVYIWCSPVQPSFLTFSRAAVVEAEKKLDSFKKRGQILVFGMIVSIFLGIIGSLVATGLWEAIISQ